MREIGILACMLLPIFGGLVMLLLPEMSERARRIWCEAVVCTASVIVWSVLAGSDLEAFALYSFTRGFQIEFAIDGPARLFAGMVSAMWPFVTLYAYEYMSHAKRRNSFFAFYIMTYGVTLMVAFSGNLVTMYVAYEMLSLVTIPLVTHYQDHDSMYAGRIYAAHVIGGAAMGFVPVVVLTMFSDGVFVKGGYYFSVLPGWFLQVLFLLGFFGFGVKAAVLPFHYWLPTATIAPTPVTALLHAVAVVNSGVFTVMRLSWYMFSPEHMIGTAAQHIALTAACVTLVYAAFHALRERHFKRRLAYSTVSNLSYMLFGIMLLTPDGLHAGLSHMLFHGVIKMSLFLCAGAFMHQSGQSYIYELSGAGRKMPLTFVFYTLGALSLTGIPMFAGFVSKWNLLLAGADAKTVWSYIGTACLIVAAFLCAMYTLSVSVRAFFPMHGTDRWEHSSLTDPNWMMLVPIGVFSVVNIVFGVYPGPILEFLGKI